VLRSSRVMVPSWSGAGLTTIRSSRVSPSPFEGLGVEEGREQVAQCFAMTRSLYIMSVQHLHSARNGGTVAAWPHSAEARFPGSVSESAWRDGEINAPFGRSRCGNVGRG
jgi:hypothetical protein